MASLTGILERMVQRMASGSVENLSIAGGIVLIHGAMMMEKELLKSWEGMEAKHVCECNHKMPGNCGSAF